MKKRISKIIYAACNSLVAFAFFMNISSVSIFFFGEPEFPTEDEN